MREILFRGKRIDNGKWVEGYFFAKPILEKYFIIEGENQWMVDPKTVGQWTGLVDKNGLKVFEGDIIESIFTKKPYIVCFGEYKCINEYDEEKYEYGWYNVDEGWFRTAFARPDEWGIVIGNIHDKAVEE